MIFLADIFDFERPSARILSVYTGEPLIGRVGVAANGQNVQISLSDPRDLEVARKGGE